MRCFVGTARGVFAKEVPNSEVWTSSENFGKRSFSTLRLASFDIL